MNERENREKAIEEMTTVVPEEMKYPLDRNTTILFSASIRKAIAKKFYDAGYRKADKDSVFHIDISEELTKYFFQNEIEDARKEAIKEFVETVIRCLGSEPYLHNAVREIAFIKFGVEVGE